jgi:glycosyltransferase involved in cell wall biosynthesis
MEVSARRASRLTGLRVFLLAIGDRQRASSRLRVWDHVRWLEEQGHSVYADCVFPASITSFNRAALRHISVRISAWFRQLLFADAVVLQEAALVSPILILRRAFGRRNVVFDFSDPIDSGLSGVFGLYKRWCFWLAVRLADAVVCENRIYLRSLSWASAKLMHQYGPVDARRYADARSARALASSVAHRPPVRVGWTGSPGTFGMISFLIPILDELAEHHDIELQLVGVSSVDFVPKRLRISCLAWREEDEFHRVADFDLGIFALDGSDISLRRGAGKLFVYMAAGVPFIASDLGIAKDVMDEYALGFRVENRKLWRDRLSEALSNFEVRARYAALGQEIAATQLSYERYRGLLIELISSRDPMP